MDYNNPNEPWMQTGYDPFKGMSDDERAKAGCLQGLAYIGMIVLGLLLCALLGSCTTTKYVEVPVVHTDTLIQTKVLKDSVYLKDSTHVSEKGDTVRIDHWHTEYVKKEVHDTLYQARVDSVPYPVEVVKEVPAQLTWWQRTRLHLFNIIGIALILIAVFYIGKWHITKLGGKP